MQKELRRYDKFFCTNLPSTLTVKLQEKTYIVRHLDKNVINHLIEAVLEAHSQLSGQYTESHRSSNPGASSVESSINCSQVCPSLLQGHNFDGYGQTSLSPNNRVDGTEDGSLVRSLSSYGQRQRVDETASGLSSAGYVDAGLYDGSLDNFLYLEPWEYQKV